jgi:hypothetical protein
VYRRRHRAREAGEGARTSAPVVPYSGRQQQWGPEAPLWGSGPRDPVVVTTRPFGRSQHTLLACRPWRSGRPHVQLPAALPMFLFRGDARAEGGPGAPCDARTGERSAVRKALVSCRGYLRPGCAVRTGSKAQNAALGASQGAVRRGPRHAPRSALAPPRPAGGGASSRHGGVCPGPKAQLGGQRACRGRARAPPRMPHALVQCAWAPRCRRGAKSHSAASAQGGACAPCATVRPGSKWRKAHRCATDSTCARQRGAGGENVEYAIRQRRWEVGRRAGPYVCHMFSPRRPRVAQRHSSAARRTAP